MNDFIFSKCEQLSEVKFPSNVSGINFNNYAFSDCKSLKTITLPACSIHFYSNVFDGSGLENVIFPEGCTLTGLGPCTFQSTQIKTITLPESCKSIDARAFYNTPLTTIHLPEALQRSTPMPLPAPASPTSSYRLASPQSAPAHSRIPHRSNQPPY